jgi:hypothetical protein
MRGRRIELLLALIAMLAAAFFLSSVSTPTVFVHREPNHLIRSPRLSEQSTPTFDSPTSAVLNEDESSVRPRASRASIDLRNASFPDTFIRLIEVDLTSPHHWVRLTWEGPQSVQQERGPFHSSPGAGLGYNDCDDVGENRRNGSNCTPKGTMRVEGFADLLPSYPMCRHVTWFEMSRQVAFHSHPQVPYYPASHGCVRLSSHAAQLIHDNAKIGETEVVVSGTWSGR